MQQIEIIRQFEQILEARLMEKPKFMQIVLGPRQIGKTTGIKNTIQKSKTPYVYASADNPFNPGNEWIIENWQKALALGEGTILALDEIQKIENWSDQIKFLWDKFNGKPKLKVILSGSASLSLGTNSKESLAGRFELIKVGHWSYYECKKAFDFNLNQFLKFGGYPGPANLIQDQERWQEYLQNSIIEPVISKDIAQVRRISKPALFRQCLAVALSYPAQEISFQKITGSLQESGNVSTVKDYLEILEQAFVLKLLYKYSTRKLTVRTSSPKILPLTPALINGFNNPSRIDQDLSWCGRIIESAIGNRLNRLPGELYYWRDRKLEVDFIWEYDQKLFAIEVKSNSSKKESGLNAFKANFPKSKILIIGEELLEKVLLEEDNKELIKLIERIAS